jgi:glycosyltransferase involved in cell wall biosynthesis
MLRIRNEARWIREVLESVLPVCERIFVLDDHSEDETVEICEQFGGMVTVLRSHFTGLDETRDKNFLLQHIMGDVQERGEGIHLTGSPDSPFWVLAIDGDEVLSKNGPAEIRRVLAETEYNAFKLPIRYLWNARHVIRVDGVYRNFSRPSLFRLMNRAFTFQSTPYGGNFHCSSIPQELLGQAVAAPPCGEAEILHLGYLHREDRIRKFHWYNEMDPNNHAEDCYRHMVVGDLYPAHSTFRHGGPLQLERRAASGL